MNIGAHVSSAGSVALAPKRAKDIGCECFQFFSRPPQGGKAKEITPEIAEDFKTNMKKYEQFASYIHAPYYINLASADNRIYYGSINVIREELERGSRLGVSGFMFHIGSAKDLGEKEGILKATKGIAEILKDYKGSTEFLIEMSAGAGATIGDSYEEIAEIINSTKLKNCNIGICFDTAHAFASGYDLRNDIVVKKTFSDFDKILGIEKLKLIHANDSKAELNSKKDRHEHIGKGLIGKDGFQAIVDFAKNKKINLILETPDGDSRINDIKILKKMRNEK